MIKFCIKKTKTFPGAPYKVSNATARGVSSQRMNVTWITGFNGGSDQTFTLNMSTDGLHYDNVESGKVDIRIIEDTI